MEDNTETTYDSLVTKTPMAKAKEYVPVICIVIACLILSIAMTLLSEDYSGESGLGKLLAMAEDIKYRLLMLVAAASAAVVIKSA